MPNFSRKDMPQVKTQDLGKALSMVADKVKVTKETIVASKLKKAQKELYKDKVQGIANRFTSPNKMKPLIISKDNHIVDGHHRWGAAIYKWGDDVKLNVHRIHLSAKNAIKLYKHIANTINEILENITIPIKVGDTVLGGKFKNKRIVVKSIDKNEKGDITINGKPLLKYRLVNEGNDQLEMMKLLSKAMKAMPGSPKQKKLKQELNKLRIKNGLEPIPESTAPNHKGKIDSELESKYGVSVDVFEYPTHLELKRIVVPDDKRGMGVGTNVMNDLIKYAVKNNKDIFTTPSSAFGGTKSRLVKFYKSFGFKNNKGSKRDFRSRESMVRLNSGLDEADTNRDYKKEYEKYGKSEKAKKYRAELNKYNRQKGTYGNGDGKDASHKSEKITGFEYQSKNRGRREKSRLKKEACWKGYKQVGGKKKGGKMVPNCVPESTLNEIPMSDLIKIDRFADFKLNPVDMVLTDKHFFDRLNDPRNEKEISNAELIGFIKRLSKKKSEFIEFLNKYNSLVATDDRTNINIPFMKKANKAIAKTVMRKRGFKTPDKRLDI